jgi:hypothetical protein
MKKIITLFLFYLGLQASSNAFADDHSEGNWIVDIGEGVAQMAHICALKSEATMNDISKIDEKLHKFLDDENIRGFRQILVPLMAVGATYDYIAFDFMDWEELGKNWDQYLGSKTGGVIASEYDKVEDCDALVAAVFPLLRRPEISSDDSRIVTVEWCTRKGGVSADQLSAKHRAIAAENVDNELVGWWGVGYPMAGVRDGVFPGDFYHLVNYTDMKTFAAAKNAIANEEGWKARADYYASYADCTGEHVMIGETVRAYQ